MHTRTKTSNDGAVWGFSWTLRPPLLWGRQFLQNPDCQIGEELETHLGRQEQVVVLTSVRVPAEGSEGGAPGELKVVLRLFVPTGCWRGYPVSSRYNLILVCWRKPVCLFLKVSHLPWKALAGERDVARLVARTQNPRFNSKHHTVWAWWHIPRIPALERWRLGYYKHKIRSGEKHGH